jgi:hypothetical protein
MANSRAVEDALRTLIERVEFEVGCMRTYEREKTGLPAKLAGEIAQPLEVALDAARASLDSEQVEGDADPCEGAPARHLTPNEKKQVEDAITAYIARRDEQEPHNRFTPRMTAHDLIKQIDAHRAALHEGGEAR